MSLSDNIWNNKIGVEIIKQFIKELKEAIHNKGRYEETEVLFLIDELAGKNLI